jgi:hypothetical protein
VATGDVPTLDLSLKIADLGSASQLKTLLQNEAMPAFQFAAAIAPYWSAPVEKCPAGTKLSFKLSQDGCWKTSTGISFGLSGSAECALEIVAGGCVVEYLDGVDADAKAKLPAGDYGGSAYVKLSLSFDITGNVSGAGYVGALGISGNAKGSADTCFLYAHRVKCGTALKDALAESLNNLVFPFQPSCAVQMQEGDIAEVTFSGCMSYGLQLCYGLGNYEFTAPSVKNVLESCTRGCASLTMPSASVDIGANFSLGLEHSDDFTAIVEKLDASNAFLYLMRAHKTDVSGGAGISAQVTITGMPAISVDQEKLQAGVNQITHGCGGAQVAALCGDLQDKLNDKVSGWLNNVVQNGASLKAAWDAQSNTTLISKYKIALSNITALDQSWSYLCQGNIRSAVGASGLLLLPGSGISRDINRQLTLTVTFFNFFHAQNTTSYFQHSKAYVTDTGDVRFLFDIGEETDSQVNKALQKARIHFVADATANSAADVKLEIELSETNNKSEAAHMAAISSYLPAGSAASSAAADMKQFAAANPKGTLNLNLTLESSAYGKLTCSPYVGNKPPAEQSTDARNWQSFHDAAVSLLDLDFAAGVTYATWQKFNEASNGANLADRRHCGDPTAGAAVWEGKPSDVQLKLNYFCLASASFMNLCDDLHGLAQVLSTIKIPDDWNRLLGDLKDIVTRDVNTDFAKPAAAALLKLCPAQHVSYDKELCGNALTCTLSLM